ncbi:hypothetical protein BD410DRAFT_776398 [Rickenella mellea]|uniref:MYND-type domain-containing protein n=1 Tax=Rickenella mellea TaxID=50990 RepID=A0A4Y7PRX2_9AGAM|nr:hypothetical protein BD410DRAFT_776398 [Rickenella mellea]
MEGETIDLHDLATVLLRERLLTEPRFKNCRLREVNDGSRPLDCLPPHLHLQAMEAMPIPRAAYFLLDDSETEEIETGQTSTVTDVIEPSTFKHPNFTSTSTSPLSDTELETIFWQCKDHDSGYVLAHSMQIVLDSFPESTKLCVQTSRGLSIVCGAHEFWIVESPIKLHQPSFICKSTTGTQPQLGPAIVGYVLDELPLVCLIFGGEEAAEYSTDIYGRVMLDLAAPMLGMRGLGGEIFAMERLRDYQHEILSRVAYEYDELRHSGRIRSPPDSQKLEEANQLANRVRARLEKIMEGTETFCGYCGKVNPAMRCFRCKQTQYCTDACQNNAWKYHKTCDDEVMVCLWNVTCFLSFDDVLCILIVSCFVFL